MGFLLSKLWSSEPANYDVPDAQTGITLRQSDLVKNTWALVVKDIKGNGVALFIKLFDYHPEYQKLFKAFANVPRNELKTNGRLLGHATSVMYAITSIVDNLNDIECLMQLLHKISESHVPRKIEAKHFQNLGVVVLDLLKEKLGPNLMNDATEAAWKKTLEVMNSVIASQMEEIVKNSK